MWLKMRNKSFNYKSEVLYALIFIKNTLFNYKFLFNNKNTKSPFFNFVELYKSLLNIFFWTKIRILYYVNNWVYTTNHKRIAVNYFWFVILAGIVGMVLATLIRLEFAYPGVGVFAGDSLQYLSMATAHGVIMVFFMIMPLLLGAFANFLLPTQLGVHDVAFPRLNSAAFWFLPGGLLMLCQLVCVDRRYQRMNCFNIREIQSLLKRKFFTDLINTHDHHTILDKTAMGLRFKTNNINAINSNIFIFYNYGIEFTSKIRSVDYFFFNESSNFTFYNNNSIFYNIVNFFNKFNFFHFLNNLYFFFSNYITCIPFSTLMFKTFLMDTLNLINIFINNVNYLTSFYSDIITTFFVFLTSALGNMKIFLYVFFGQPTWYTGHVFDMVFNYILTICYNNIYFLLQLNFFKNYLFSLFNVELFNFKNLNFSLSNFFYEFFFFIKFFEIFYLYNITSQNNILNYFNDVFFVNNFFIFFSNFKNFFFSYFFFNNYTLSNNIEINKINNNENLLFINNNNLTLSHSFFNNSFYSKLDYNSYFVYFYILIYFIINLPGNIFFFIKNIFDIKTISDNLFYFYESLTTWYIPTLLNDNLFYLTYKNFNFNNSIFNYKDFIIFWNNIINFFNLSYNLPYIHFNFVTLFFSYLNLIHVIFFNVFFNIFNIFSILINSLTMIIFSNKTNSIFIFIYNFFFNFENNSTQQILTHDKNFYTSNYFNNSNISFITQFTNEENSDASRYLRFYNPIFKYDYKSGDYFPKLYKEVYNSLFITISELTSSIRTASWFLSDKYIEAFNTNFSNYYDNITKTINTPNFTMHTWNNNRFNNTDAFYNFFYILSNDFNYTNKKWIALNTLNQKFYKMFNTSSMQQRIYANWRQLKFTREAWRCKLLAARHQKTLFRRYVHEDGVFWSIERNAKDLLPGWAMITPFSSRTRFTAVGKTDIGLMGVFLVLNSSIISAANFLVTTRYLATLNNRKMRDARVFFTESVVVSCWMMIFANPMLAISILMLLSDRHWQTSFFDYSGGGDTVLFQHMFWFFGHPEVYIIIIPTFGFVNSMMSYYLRKRVSARASLMYSMYTIAFLGFFVWGHHMYMVGLAHTTRMLFSTLTVMISVPAATKIMHWCVTTVNSAIAMELPLLFSFTFIFLFVSGGISGMCVAHTGMDVLFHDTFYVVGHFHVMLAGSAMFSSFGGFYFYFPAIFGVKYSRIYAYLHYVYYLLGQLMTVIPMFWLGYAGMPRRVLDYPASMGGWHSVISAGHLLSVAGLIAFFIMIFDSLRQGRAVTRNTFGIGRYNTRLNFYLYEISRLIYIQQKGWFFFRFVKPTSIKLNNLNYLNFEPYETTLITYTFSKK